MDDITDTTALPKTAGRISWPAVITWAKDIVDSYTTSVTLRQLFYLLVSAQLLPNSLSKYKTLSRYTAEARRNGTFPPLIDQGRTIHEHVWFTGTGDALSWLSRIYRLDRTRNQDVSLYLGVEKAGMVDQLESWFGPLGIPVLALGGYASQGYVDEIAAHTRTWGRPAVLLYAGDFDPSGEDITRDFIARSACWDEMIRVALSGQQVSGYALARNIVEKGDPRAPAFCAKYGLSCEPVKIKGKPGWRYQQVELDALDPGRPAGAVPGGHRPVLGHVRIPRSTRRRAA